MVRYHLYYQISKFLKDPSKLEFDQGSKEINTWLSERPKGEKVRNYRYSKNSKKYVTGITYQKVTGQSPNDINDYKMFIATTTDGLNKIGQKLLRQSIESYMYAVLGAQAKTRWSIVGEGANLYKPNDHERNNSAKRCDGNSFEYENSHHKHKRRSEHGYLSGHDTRPI